MKKPLSRNSECLETTYTTLHFDVFDASFTKLILTIDNVIHCEYVPERVPTATPGLNPKPSHSQNSMEETTVSIIPRMKPEGFTMDEFVDDAIRVHLIPFARKYKGA